MKLIYKYNDKITIETEFTTVEQKNFQMKLLKYTIVDLDEENVEKSLQLYRDARAEASKTAQESNETIKVKKRSKATSKDSTDVLKTEKVAELSTAAEQVFPEEDPIPATVGQKEYMDKLGIKYDNTTTKVQAINKINDFKRSKGWKVDYDPNEKK